jgi:hypothetical protein
MSGIEFVNGETYTSSCGMTGSGRYTPIYMIAGGKKYFVRNALEKLSGESHGWRKYHNEKSADEVKNAKAQLVENGGKYYTLYSIKKDPIEFLDWVCEKGYTLQVFGKLFDSSDRKDGAERFTDFHGNLVEYSAAFNFRIYDTDILATIQSRTANMPKSEV